MDQVEPAKVLFEEREGYLYAFATGERDSLTVSLDYWQRIIQECYRRGAKKLLLEEDFPNQATTLEMYTLLTAVAKMLTKPLKIAFVDRRSEQHELNLFGEHVAVNRGVNGRLFEDPAAAVAWLKS